MTEAITSTGEIADVLLAQFAELATSREWPGPPVTSPIDTSLCLYWRVVPTAREVWRAGVIEQARATAAAIWSLKAMLRARHYHSETTPAWWQQLELAEL